MPMTLSVCRTRWVAAVCAAVLALGVAPLLGSEPAAAISGSTANIVNDPTDYPFVGRFQAKQKNGWYLCSAVLIAPRFALTAAHCPQGKTFADEHISFGGIRDSDPKTFGAYPAGSFTVGVMDGAVMPHTDLALLLLDSPVPNAPAQLPTADDASLWGTGALTTVLGWGNLDRKGTTSSELRRATEMITDTQSSVLKVLGKNFEMKADPSSPVIGAIESGDSGGPMLGTVTDGRSIVVGITSQGAPCGSRLCPGYFIRVGAPQVLTWIANTRDSLLAANTRTYSTEIRPASDVPVTSTGETFYQGQFSVNVGPNTGLVYLAGSQDGTASFFVDDYLSVTVTHPDGSTQVVSQDFSGNCMSLFSLPRLSLRSALVQGINTLDIRMSDICGGNDGSSDVWLLGEDAPVATAGR